jgi:hypothetical protein
MSIPGNASSRPAIISAIKGVVKGFGVVENYPADGDH